MRRDIPLVTEEASAEHVAGLMRDENLGFLPVITDESTRRLVGVVTDRDLAVRVVAENLPARTTRIGELVSGPVLSASPDDDLAELERKMVDNEVRRLPVVDADGALLGVVSIHDIAQVEDEERTGEVFREVSKGSSRV